MNPSAPPGLNRILETVLYCREEAYEEMIRFYDLVLGLQEQRVFEGMYRLGSGMLLLFSSEKSMVKVSPPPHGTAGRAHTCFVAPDGAYDHWKDWIQAASVPIIQEIHWTSPFHGRSFYFHDPAGNVLEIADRDIWPKTAAGRLNGD